MADSERQRLIKILNIILVVVANFLTWIDIHVKALKKTFKTTVSIETAHSWLVRRGIISRGAIFLHKTV